VGELNVPFSLVHNQQQLRRHSVQASNANISSLNDMFKVVTTTFQQIMTKFNGADSEKDRIMTITKTLLKLMKQNDR
jgi:Na+/phosphate symporter